MEDPKLRTSANMNQFNQNNDQQNYDDSDMPMDQNNNNNKKNPGCCKRISKFIFSHIGLVIMVIIYAVAGSFLFQLLEQHEEAKMCQEGKGQESTNIVNLKSQLLTYIQFNISTNPADTTKDNETVANANIESWLENYRDQVNSVRDTYKYNGQDCATSRWNFAGALLFAITVITTIGYGNIAPVTWEGQVVCICYATIGIPLFLMCIANISGVLGDMFRYLYARVCCRLCLKKKSKPMPDGGAPMPGQHGEITGGGMNKMANNKPVGVESMSQWANNKDLNLANPKTPGYYNKNNNGAKVIDDNEEENNFKNNNGQPDEDEKVTVPLTITMIIITLYILLGAVVFNLFEGWTPVQAGYFCYITLATIGFGDFVPGQKTDDPYAGAKLACAAIYVLFGMAILAMCFDLMQEEIIAKFTWLGKKLGIVDKDEDDEAEELAAKNEKLQQQQQKEQEMMKGGGKDGHNNNNNNNNSNKPNYVASPVHGGKANNFQNESPAPGYYSGNEAFDDDHHNMNKTSTRSPFNNATTNSNNAVHQRNTK